MAFGDLPGHKRGCYGHILGLCVVFTEVNGSQRPKNKKNELKLAYLGKILMENALYFSVVVQTAFFFSAGPAETTLDPGKLGVVGTLCSYGQGDVQLIWR